VSATTVGWTVPVGVDITASIADPPGGLYGHTLGARVEVPVTRAIVSAYQRATLSGGVWTVTLDGVLESGGFEFVWRTDDAEPPYYEAWIPLMIAGASAGVGGGGDAGGVSFPPIDAEQITPSTSDVAILERTRIVEPGGGDPGDFTDNTHPTSDEVEELIQHAIDITLNLLPAQVDPRHYEAIERAIALRAASLVEASYFREQANEGSLAYYRELFDDVIQGVNVRVAEDYRQAALVVSSGAVILT
jgi:hypothetical protein